MYLISMQAEIAGKMQSTYLKKTYLNKYFIYTYLI